MRRKIFGGKGYSAHARELEAMAARDEKPKRSPEQNGFVF
jgi:hypothetical protein